MPVNLHARCKNGLGGGGEGVRGLRALRPTLAFRTGGCEKTPHTSETQAGAPASYTISLLSPRLHKMTDYLSTHPTCPRATSHPAMSINTWEGVMERKSLFRKKCPRLA